MTNKPLTLPEAKKILEDWENDFPDDIKCVIDDKHSPFAEPCNCFQMQHLILIKELIEAAQIVAREEQRQIDAAMCVNLKTSCLHKDETYCYYVECDNYIRNQILVAAQHKILGDSIF